MCSFVRDVRVYESYRQIRIFFLGRIIDCHFVKVDLRKKIIGLTLLKMLPMNRKEKVMPAAMCTSYCGGNLARRDLAEWILAHVL